MNLTVKNIKRDYSNAAGLFNAGQFQDVLIYDEQQQLVARLLVKQSYEYSNQWGSMMIEGSVEVSEIDAGFKDYIALNYGDLTLSVVNTLFNPLDFTTDTGRPITI